MSEPELTPDDIHALQHSLGISDGRTKEYRNHYADEPDCPQMAKLIAMGLMKRGYRIPGGLQMYHVTEAGKKIARDNLPPPPSKKKRRYLRYLDASDAYPDLTFREFLTEPEWKEAGDNP